jgi:hypothetical protein
MAGRQGSGVATSDACREVRPVSLAGGQVIRSCPWRHAGVCRSASRKVGTGFRTRCATNNCLGIGPSRVTGCGRRADDRSGAHPHGSDLNLGFQEPAARDSTRGVERSQRDPAGHQGWRAPKARHGRADLFPAIGHRMRSTSRTYCSQLKRPIQGNRTHTP